MARIPEARDELASTLAARQELGPGYEEALVDGFLDRVGQAIDERVDRRLASGAPAARHSNNLALPLGSVALAIPITAVAASDLHGAAALVGVVVAWLGIVGVNVAHALGRRRG